MAQIAVFVVIFGVMYAVLIYPQQKRQKETRLMLAALEEGDEVLLTSGVYGFVTALDPRTVWVEVAPNVELKVSRSAVGGIVEDDAADDDAEND